MAVRADMPRPAARRVSLHPARPKALQVATLVFFHAHPDDEAISTGGTMALAAAAGHRVVLVVATKGEEGEVDDGFLDDGETLEERRVRETHSAAEILGVSRVEFLGYRDSGMMGEGTNGNRDCFWQADVSAAAKRLARLLQEERAVVLTVYDDHGGYGHPDHIQVHRVGHEAARLAGTPRVFEATMNRDRVKETRRSRQASDEADQGVTDAVYDTLGTADAAITTAVDVTEVLDAKRAAMAAHPSQIGPDSWFLQLSPENFTRAFGIEWFVRTSPPFTGEIPAGRDSWLLED